MTPRSAKIGLGTVQWGMAYGVANRGPQTSIDEVERIMAVARSAGITLLDTAMAYGEAEMVLGQLDLTGMHVVTKTPRFERQRMTDQEADELIKSFRRSLRRLRCSSVYGLLVHHVDDLLVPGGERLVEAMLALRQDGLVQRIGLSVYTSEQISAALRLFTPDLVQLPLSVFDQRLARDGSIERLKSLGVEIHARSVFLQGLLLMPPATVPVYFQPWQAQLQAWHSTCEAKGVRPQHAALAFACDLPQIDGCVVGVQSYSQLEELLNGLDTVSAFDVASFSCHDVELINPARWCIK